MLIRITNTRAYFYKEDGDQDAVVKKLKKDFVAYAPGFKFIKAYKLFRKTGGKHGWDGQVHLFTDNSISTGLLPKALDLIRKKTKINIQDDRDMESFTCFPTSVILRPYQKEAINLAITNTFEGVWWPRGIIQVATGGGKTIIAAAMIHMTDKRTVHIVHTKSLLHQTYEVFHKLGINVGRYGDGIKDTENQVIVATVQSLMSKPPAFLAEVEQVFNDECFPCKQNVLTENGPVPIGKLFKLWTDGQKVPKVKSFNLVTNKFEYKKITNAWRKSAKSLLEIKIGTNVISCTSNHKFLTPDGWKEAHILSKGDTIIGNYIKTKRANQIQASLNKDQLQIVLGSYLGDGSIHTVRENKYRLKIQHGIQQEEYCRWKSLFFNSKLRSIEKNGYAQTPAVRFSSKTFSLPGELPNKETCPQWVLDTIDERALAIWFLDDGSFNHKVKSIALHTESFNLESQLRFVKFFKKYNIETKISKSKNKYYYLRFNKASYIKIIKLLTPYANEYMKYKIEPDNNKYEWNFKFPKYGHGIISSIKEVKTKPRRNRSVFDIEVEDLHNYIVCTAAGEGIIAHNCHHLAATVKRGNIFVELSNMMPNAYMRWGLTATPFMKDKYSDMLLEGATGKILFKKSSKDLIDDKYLTPAEIDMILISKNEKVPNKWPDCYNMGIVSNVERNTRIAEEIDKAVKPCLILVTKIDHGAKIQNLCKSVVPFLSGTDDSTVRQETIDNMVKNKTAVICTTIFDEGVDIPDIRTVILAGGGKSQIKTIQRLGRGLRLAEGKDSVKVLDFIDYTCNLLNYHSRNRKATWEKEGFTVRVVE